MLSFLLDTIREKGFKDSRLYTDKIINRNAYDIYIKHGFYEDAQYEYDFVTMVKPLIDGYTPKKWEGTPLGFVSEVPPHHCS